MSNYLSEHFKIKCNDKSCKQCILCIYKSEEKLIEKGYFIVRKETTNQLFYVYKSYESFKSDEQLESNATYHEIVFANTPQKLRIDLDFKEVRSVFDINIDINKYIESVICILNATFFELYGAFDIDNEVVWCICSSIGETSEGKFKMGYHITSANHFVTSSSNANTFLRKFSFNYSSNIYDQKLLDIPDIQVAKSIQNWRIINFAKYNQPQRTKEIDQLSYVLYPHYNFSDNSALLSQNHDKSKLPDINQLNYNNKNDLIDSVAICESEYSIVYSKVRARMTDDDKESFILPRFTQNEQDIYVNFSRIKESYCDMCKRNHESENSLYFIYNKPRDLIQRRCMRFKKN